MPSTSVLRRRAFGTILSVLALSSYLAIGRALPARATSNCYWDYSTDPDTWLVVLPNEDGTYVSGFAPGAGSDVDLNLTPFNCTGGFTSATVNANTVAIVSAYGSTNQTLTLTDVGLFGGTLTINLNAGTEDRFVLKGGSGADTLAADRASLSGVENTVVDGAAGDDTLLGTSGADTLVGGEGADTLTGGDGADVLVGGPGADAMACGAGTDEVSYAGAFGQVTATLNGTGEGGDALGDTSVACELLRGSDYIDTLNGTSAADVIYGGSSGDTINGGRGNDTLYGEAGMDVLNGNGGSDTLSGGEDNDSLLYGGGTDTLDGGAGINNCEGYTGSATGSKKFGRVTYSNCSI